MWWLPESRAGDPSRGGNDRLAASCLFNSSNEPTAHPPAPPSRPPARHLATGDLCSPYTKMARSWIPKPKARLIPITLALGFVFWGLLYISSQGPPPGHFPGEDFPPRRYPPPPRPHNKIPPPLPSTVWGARSEQVRLAFLHAYRGYNEYAASHDELLPLSQGWTDK